MPFKRGDLVNVRVKRYERYDMIFDLDVGIDAILPRAQQLRTDRYAETAWVRAVIIDMPAQRGSRAVLSRTDPQMLVRMFEAEVPEIFDGTVAIKGAVREAGERAKIAVTSRERGVDPVAACIGRNGSHVQPISRELGGEAIDVILWAEDLASYARNALAPARVNSVAVRRDPATNRPRADAVVDDDQLSIALGPRGVNVRLASELIGATTDVASKGK